MTLIAPKIYENIPDPFMKPSRVRKPRRLWLPWIPWLLWSLLKSVKIIKTVCEACLVVKH